jgi:hypothetical protein
MLHGIIAGTTFNANQSLVLNNASVFANAGLVLNTRNLTLNGNQISSTSAATCTDKSGQNLCVNGKPKFVSAFVSVPKPDFTALKTKYTATPNTTIQNSLNLNSSQEISAKFDNQIVLIKGNLHLHAIATIKNAVIIVTESFKSNKDLTLENTRIIAKEAQFNHTTNLNNSRIITDEDLSFNGKLESNGLSSVITNKSFTSNGTGLTSSSGELAVIANQNITLNQVSSGKVVLWAGSNITVNQNSTLEGAMVAGGKVVLNSSVSLIRVSSHLNADVPGGGQLPYGTREEGVLRDGGTWTSSFGVSITAPVGSLRKPEIKVFVEIVDPTKLEKPLPDEVELADQGVYRIGAVGGASTKPTNVINLFQIRLPLQNPNPNRDLSVLILIPGYYTSFHNDSPELEWNGSSSGNAQDSNSITMENSILDDKGSQYAIVKSKIRTQIVNQSPSSIKAVSRVLNEFSISCATDSLYKSINCDPSLFSVFLSRFQTEYQNITNVMSMGSISIGSKNVFLAQSGKGRCATSLSVPVLAFYSPEFSTINICIDSSGQPVGGLEKVQKTLRHELFHGFQWVYIDKLIINNTPEFNKIKWIIESTAEAAIESNESAMQVSTNSYSLDLIRQVTQRFPLKLSENPRNAVWIYQTQDFWIYAGLYKNFGLRALKPLFESQLLDPMNDLDKFFNDKSFDDNLNTGMRAAYWLWAKNQAYEKTQNFRQQGKPCTPVLGALQPDSDNETTYSLATTPKLEWTALANALPEKGVAPLETRVLKIKLTDRDNLTSFKQLSLKVTNPDDKPLDKQKIRYKWYSDPNPKDKPTCGVGEDTEVDTKNRIKYAPIKNTRNLYLLISNVSIDKATSAERNNLEDVKVTIEPVDATMLATSSTGGSSINLSGTVGSNTNTEQLKITNTGDFDSTLEFKQYFSSTNIIDASLLNPNSPVVAASRGFQTRAVKVPPSIDGSLIVANGFTPSSSSEDVLTKTKETPEPSSFIDVNYYCSSAGIFEANVNVVYKTGAVDENGVEVLANAVVPVTATCVGVPTGSVYSGSEGGSIGLTAKVGETVTSNAISYSNIGIGSSSDPATLTTSISTSRAWITVTPSSDSVLPGQSSSFTITASCVSLGVGTYSGTVTLTTNTGRTITWMVNLTCVGSPKIAVSSTALNFKARVNSSVTSSFVVQNNGDVNLSATIDLGDFTSVSFATSSVVAPHSSGVVNLTTYCGSVIEVRTDNIRIFSNDPVTPVLDVPLTLTCTDIVLSGPTSARMVSSDPTWSPPASLSIPIQNLSSESGAYTASLFASPYVKIVGGASGDFTANSTVQIDLVGTCPSSSTVSDFTLSISVDDAIRINVPVTIVCAPILHAATVAVGGLDCGATASVSTSKPYPDWFVLVSGYGNLITLPRPCFGPSNAVEAMTKGQQDADAHLFVPAEGWELPCRSAYLSGYTVACRREQWANAKARFDALTTYIR